MDGESVTDRDRVREAGRGRQMSETQKTNSESERGEGECTAQKEMVPSQSVSQSVSAVALLPPFPLSSS